MIKISEFSFLFCIKKRKVIVELLLGATCGGTGDRRGTDEGRKCQNWPPQITRDLHADGVGSVNLRKRNKGGSETDWRQRKTRQVPANKGTVSLTAFIEVNMTIVKGSLVS